MTEATLTDNELIAYLLSQRGMEKMPGTIRTKEKCPKCNKPFVNLKAGLICKKHKTVPQRFFIDVYFSGRQIKVYSHKSGLVLSSYDLAQETLKHIQYEIRTKTFDPSRYVKADIREYLFENVIDKFLVNKEIEETKGNISPAYIDSLKNYIENYMKPFFNGRDVREIRTKDIEDFYHQMPKRKEKTLKNVVDSLRHFFNHLYKIEMIDRIPAYPIIRVSESIPRWTSADNQSKLLEAIPEKHRPIYTFILYQGCRPSEARCLKWRDLDLQNKIVIIRRTYSKNKIVERTKGRNVKPRMIHPLVFDMLKNVPRGLPDAFVFTNPRTRRPYSKTRLEVIFMGARTATGIDINIYAAGRHSVATNAAMAGVDARIIRDYLGHADIKTTEIYTHLDVMAQRQIFEKTTIPRLSPRQKKVNK